jgi:hypothetical protein
MKDHDQSAQAIESLTTAASSLGIAVAAPAEGGEPRVDLLIDDRRFLVQPVAVAYATGPWVASAIANAAPGTPYVVVADRITAEARDLMTAAGWSWLDRRGRLHLRGPGIRVDTEVTPETRRPDSAGPPVTGRSGITGAFWLCAHPGQALSPTKSAPELRLAPSSISVTVRRLAEAGLVDEGGAAVLPELFWELAGAWKPEWTWLIERPDRPARRSGQGGWRMSGTRAASALGAPLVATEDQPWQLYVPGPVEVSIAARQHGLTKPGLGAAAVAVPPTNLATAGAEDGAPIIDGWPVAPLVAIALDLAQDRARGREILSDWEVGRGIWL